MPPLILTRVFPTDSDQRRIGWSLAALGMVLVSFDSLWIRASKAGAWEINFWVSALSLPLYAALSIRNRGDLSSRQIRADRFPMAVTATLAAASQALFVIALGRSSVANVVAVVASAPVLAAAVAWLFLRERTSRRVMAAIAITVAGVLVVVGGSLGNGNVMGDLLALGAVACFAINMNIWRRHPQMDRYLTLAAASTITVLVSSVFASPMSLDTKAFLALGAMAITNPLGRLAHTNAPRFAPVSEVALFVPIETVTGTLWAWLFFSEAPELATLLGAAIILGGVLFGTLKREPTAE